MCVSFGDKAREARLRWFGHVNWGDDGGGGCRRWTHQQARGRSKRRFVDTVREDMCMDGGCERKRHTTEQGGYGWCAMTNPNYEATDGRRRRKFSEVSLRGQIVRVSIKKYRVYCQVTFKLWLWKRLHFVSVSMGTVLYLSIDIFNHNCSQLLIRSDWNRL